jgi:zinc transport system substrate-binding protein
MLFRLLIVALLTPAWAWAAPRVLTDIAPVHSLVSMVMGDLGTPELLIEGSSDPHHFQFRPSQARALAKADLVVWVGPELTPWLVDHVAALSPDAKSLALLNWLPVEVQPTAEQGARDPHAWLNPEIAAGWIEQIAAQLAAVDPQNSAGYLANAQSASATLAAADQRLFDELRPARARKYIAAHDAFAYFAAHFGVNIVASVTDVEGSSAGARRLLRINRLIGQERIDCILAEPGQTGTLPAILKDAGIPVSELDPVGATIAPGPGLYMALLDDIAKDILSCGNGGT